MYDVLMRLPFLGWVIFCAAAQVRALIRFVNTTTSTDSVYIIHIAMRLSTLAFILLVAIAVILRARPSAKAGGLEPRLSALAGTFLLFVFALFPRRDLPISAEITSTLLIMIGNVGAVIALSQLGRSFSLMAESRQLVTSGPYRFVRHPLYCAEAIAVIGVFMQFASLWTSLLFVMQIAFQLRRMHNEELVLAKSFPEYLAYRQTTARLIPRIY